MRCQTDIHTFSFFSLFFPPICMCDCIAAVICELEAKSGLNTSVELNSGETTVATSSVPNRFIREAGNDTSNTTMEEGEMSHEEHGPISNEDYTNSHGNESGSEEDENEPITDEDEDEDEYEDEGEDESVSWEDDTTNSDSQMTENDMRMMELLNLEESKFDEEQMEDDDNKMSDDEDESEEESQEDLEDADERGGRMRRDTNERKIQKRSTWSLKYYGLFQLSDSHFCQSEDRWSRNVCNSTCSGKSLRRRPTETRSLLVFFTFSFMCCVLMASLVSPSSLH